MWGKLPKAKEPHTNEREEIAPYCLRVFERGSWKSRDLGERVTDRKELDGYCIICMAPRLTKSSSGLRSIPDCLFGAPATVLFAKAKTFHLNCTTVFRAQYLSNHRAVFGAQHILSAMYIEGTLEQPRRSKVQKTAMFWFSFLLFSCCNMFLTAFLNRMSWPFDLNSVSRQSGDVPIL